MMPGFIEVNFHQFYREIWPRIENDVDAINSNRKEIKTCLKEQRVTPPLLIYWGYKDETTSETVVLAVSQSNGITPDKHWVAPHLIGVLSI